jgi:hypothetical protein
MVERAVVLVERAVVLVKLVQVERTMGPVQWVVLVTQVVMHFGLVPSLEVFRV